MEEGNSGPSVDAQGVRSLTLVGAKNNNCSMLFPGRGTNLLEAQV